MKKMFILFSLLTFLIIPDPISAQGWSATTRLSWNSGDSEYPDIASDSGNNVHVIWRDNTPGQYDIFYKKSTDKGTSWSALNRLTWDPRFSLGTDLVIDTLDNLHLAWNNGTSVDYDIFYKKSTDGGTNWSSPKRLTWSTEGAVGPKMAVDSTDHVHMVYQVNLSSNTDLFYKKSTNNGQDWSPPKRLTWNSGLSWRQDIAIDSNDDIYIVWDDTTPGESEIYYKKSTDGGSSWSAIDRLTWNSGPSHSPSIAVDSNDNVHIVWADHTPGNNEIYYKMSTNGGSSWQSPKRLTWNSGDSNSPDLAVNPRDVLHVFWHDDSTGDFEIYCKISLDNGTTWFPVDRITWSNTHSWNPRIAISNVGDLHLTWIENLGNNEILYKNKIAN